MAQQMVNGSHYQGSVTITNRDSSRYAVVNPPYMGKHCKPQDSRSLSRRKTRWALRKLGFTLETIDKILRRIKI